MLLIVQLFYVGMFGEGEYYSESFQCGHVVAIRPKELLVYFQTACLGSSFARLL